MRIFKDRCDAGKRLALELQGYCNKNVLVLAIPHGGVEIGYYIAKNLNADFDIVISRKLPFPNNPESGFGAIAEDCTTYMIPQYADSLNRETIEKIIEQQKNEISKRIKKLRNDKPITNINGRTIIIADDGIAMGSTMMVSIMFCKNQNAKKIIAASPVSGIDTYNLIDSVADHTCILETPTFFRAVAESYANWSDVSANEAIKILEKWKQTKKTQSIQQIEP